MKTIQTVENVSKLILEGKILLLAGDESALSKLPKGNWIAGTIPYFMTEDKGGVFNKEKIYVDDFTSYANDFIIKTFDVSSFSDISENIYDNGFTMFIIPAFSEIHEYFAINNYKIKKLYSNPFIGWVSGFDLNSENGIAKIFNGHTGEIFSNQAIALFVKLPQNKKAGVNIVNIFNENSKGDTIEFLDSGFSVKKCLINGVEENFADYISFKNIDTKLPIVANYSGVRINVSIKEVNTENKIVHFYAPVFQNRTYQFAENIYNYVREFKQNVNEIHNEMPFSCNCILNYLYGDFENDKIEIGGPITFGEIAYNLLNQTLVYMTINDA